MDHAQTRLLLQEGLHIAVRSVGPEAAPPVVFLHGWGSSARMWDTTAAVLSQAFRCISLDLPGHGDSDKPPHDWYTIPRFAAAVAEVCRRLHLARPTLVGHSMGGTVALELAAEGAMPLAGLVAVNPVVDGSRTPVRPWLERASGPVLGVLRWMWPLAARWWANGHREPESAGSSARQRQRADLLRTTPEAALGSARAVMNHNLFPKLSRIHTPTLILVGERDNTVHPWQGAAAARRIPGARLQSLPCGHHPMDEVPEAFQAALRDFLLSEVLA